MTTKKKTTTKKVKETNTEFKVRKIANGYLVTIWDTVDFTDDKVIHCVDRDEVLTTIQGLIF